MERYIQFEGEVNKFSDLLKVEPAGREIVECLIRIEGHVKGAIAEVGDLPMDSVDNKMVDESLHWLMSVVSNEFLNVNSSDTIYALLTRVSERINAVLRSGRESISMLEDLNVKHMEVMRVILPPDELDPPLGGDGQGMERPDLSVNKLSLFINFLREKGVYSNDIFVVVGRNEPNMMRESSYLQIEIPKLKKIVLLNVDYGEATFVVNMSEDYSAWDVLGAKKSELIDEFGAKRILFSENQINKWYADLSLALFDGEIDGCCDADVYAKNRLKMDSAYFTPENVMADLEAFAKNMKREVRELNLSSRVVGTSAKCCNGNALTFMAYLVRAGRAIFAYNKEDAIKNSYKTLKYLLSFIGVEIIPEMDLEYFDNVDNLKHDLAGFVLGWGEDKVLEDLSSSIRHKNPTFVCNNGESVMWATYAARFAKVKLNWKAVESTSKANEVIDAMRLAVGLENKKRFKIERSYFTAENVFYDLKLFAQEILGDCDAWVDLTTGRKALTSSILCKGGGEVTLRVYICFAGSLLEFNTSRAADANRAAILDELKKIAGEVVSDF